MLDFAVIDGGVWMGKRKPRPVVAFAEERLVELRRVPPSGVSSEGGGPKQGEPTRTSYPSLGGRATRRARPWEATDDPLEAVTEDEDPIGLPEIWTPELVRAWLGEAMETIRRLPAKGCFPSRGGSGWPEWVRDVRLGYNSEGQVVSQQQDSRRRHPTKVEMTRLDVVLTWPYWIADIRRRKAAIGVALGLDLRTVGREAGCSKDTARTWARQGFQQIADALNAMNALWGGER